MEKVFKVVDGKPQLLRDELELIPEFKALLIPGYNKQPGDLEGRRRIRGLNELMYIWYLHSLKSPFKEYSDEEKLVETKAIVDLPFKEDQTPEGIQISFEESTQLRSAISKYIELNESMLTKLIKSAERAIHKLRGYFDSLDFSKTTENGALVNKPSDVIKTISDLHKVHESLKKLYKEQIMESGQTINTRGDQEKGWIMEEQENESD